MIRNYFLRLPSTHSHTHMNKSYSFTHDPSPSQSVQTHSCLQDSHTSGLTTDHLSACIYKVCAYSLYTCDWDAVADAFPALFLTGAHAHELASQFVKFIFARRQHRPVLEIVILERLYTSIALWRSGYLTLFTSLAAVLDATAT